MAQGTGQMALSKAEFDEWDRTGKRPPKRSVPAPPTPQNPEQPNIKDLIPDGKVKAEDVKGAPTGRMSPKKNKDGMIFTGYDVSFQLKNGKAVHGWMEDGVYCELRRLLGFEDEVNTAGME